MANKLVLIDTNVIVAALAEAHEYHAPSLSLFNNAQQLEFAVAAHCYAEAFTTLTRRGAHAPFRWPAGEAWAALESIAAVTRLVGLTPAQSFASVRDFAAVGHTGARIYDFLIAQAAQAARAEMLVTWNVGHFRGLVDGLEILTPMALRSS